MSVAVSSKFMPIAVIYEGVMVKVVAGLSSRYELSEKMPCVGR